jgi:hypothetical protein
MARVRLAQAALVLTGGGLLLVGLNGLAAPGALLAPLGIPLEGPPALSEARANYGGMHVGMGLFLLSAAALPGLRRAGLLATLAFTGGLAIGRLVSLAVDGMPSPFVWFLLTTELGAAGLALAALGRGPAPR